MLYVPYIRPIVEYSYVVFDSISDGVNTRIDKKIENVLVNCFRCHKGIAYAAILLELGWESLQARRERRKLILFADSVHGNAPSYLQQDLPHASSLELRTFIIC